MIIILGMHRSGTSALTRALGALGAWAGDDRHLGPHQENVPLRHVNEKLLQRSGGAWDCPPPGSEWLSSTDSTALASRARATLEREFGNFEAVTVWKDPRTCVTLPFWLDRLGVETPVLVLVYRHPTEVAASLSTRNGLGIGHSYALWERYNADALRAASGLPMIVLSYAEIVTDPAGVLAGVAASLADWGVTLPNDPTTTDTGLVPQRRHHTAPQAEAIDDDFATPSQRELLLLLGRLEGAHRSLDVGPFPTAGPLSGELLVMAAKLRAAIRATKRLRQHASDPDAPLDDDEHRGLEDDALALG